MVPAFSRTARAGSWRARAGSGTPAKCSTTSRPRTSVARGGVAGVDALGLADAGGVGARGAAGAREADDVVAALGEQRSRCASRGSRYAGDEEPHARPRYAATVCS